MTAADQFPGRLALQQRVLPSYRVAFLDLLAESCQKGLHIYAGRPLPGEAILQAERLLRAEWARADNRHLGRGPLRVIQQPGLVDWLERKQPDALILESNPRYLSSWGASDWMRARGRPVLGWGLGVPAKPGVGGLVACQIWRRWLDKLDAVISYSSAGAAEYIAAGFPAGRVFVALNSVVAPGGVHPQRDPAVGRPLRMLYVGRLQARKRLGLLFRAVHRAGIEAQVRVVGEGPAREQFEEAARATGAEVEFMGSMVGDRLDDQYAWADVFVLPGTGGLAVQQAMASGLPVVVARGDGTQADLVSARNGWLVKPGDEQALAEALAQASQEPKQLLARGRESFRIVQEQANIEAMRTVFLRALNAVVAEN